jgi:hypothetical protein
VRRSPLLTAAVVLVPALPVLLATAWTPGYDARRETVSRLASAGQPYAGPVRAARVVTGVLVGGAARSAAGGVARGRRLVRGLLIVAGAATVVAGLVPKDPPATPPTTASTVHVAAAVLAGTCVVAAMGLAARWGRRRVVRRASAVAAAVSACAGAAFPFLWGTVAYGVLERVVLVAAGGWLLTVSERSQR